MTSKHLPSDFEERVKMLQKAARSSSDKVLALKCGRVIKGTAARAELNEVRAILREEDEQRRLKAHAERDATNAMVWKELYGRWCWLVPRQLWSVRDFEDVPVRTPEINRIRDESDPVFDFWPADKLDSRRKGLREFGSYAGSAYGWEPQGKGVSLTAHLLGVFQDDAEMRAAAWIGASLWGWVSDRCSGGYRDEAVNFRIGREMLTAAEWRLGEGIEKFREAPDTRWSRQSCHIGHWHHAMSEVLPTSPREVAGSALRAQTRDDYLGLAVMQFVWVRATYRMVRVYHVDDASPRLVSVQEPNRSSDQEPS